MTDGRCPSCGKPLPARGGGRGRTSKYCSPACRQKAYRERQQPSADTAVPALIADIEQRVRRLAPQLPDEFYTDVTDLASTVGRLRRIAQLARDASAGETAGNVTPARVTPNPPENVTPPAVTEENVTAEDVTETGSDDVTDDGVTKSGGEDDVVTAAVRSGDEWDFAGLVEPYRHELQVHCYRMVGSYDDAEDMVQETFLRAWNRRDAFEGRSTFRAWLYRIATNACLDFLRRNERRPQRYEPVPGMDNGAAEAPARVTWLQPYPDALLEDVASTEVQPEGAAVSRETMELVFLAAIQHLPPRQRAVLILRDVLGWPAADTAEQLDMSVASVNSALQRARPALRRHLPSRRSDWTASARPTGEEREILQRYMDAADQADAAVVAELLSEDVVLTMPPNPFWFVGRDAMMAFIKPSIDPASPHFQGTWKHLPTFANRQPAAAGYLRRPGTTVYRAQVLDVLRIEGGRIVEITSFEPHLFPAFGLPLTL
ncbi:sigma-70 family RNA polymerase sigma factor [Amycolatopsis rifamycinica]|uniref:RNA polymerase subunit sigma-70 n=1 Tax=Amycolatopsis rifamycinica TaxID=287986 RepID=A0A066TUM5_9PSEU|nr:sigma-70 family RNA polymerase sigma factor [Amycolatopsis rifamycinica]KDN18896.1 RNA polymerase subunit sigma-70 [Amycolatopsis rifamycinica]